MRVLLLVGAMVALTGCGTGAQSISYNADPLQFAPSSTLEDHHRSLRAHKKYQRKVARGKSGRVKKRRHVRRPPAPPPNDGVVPDPTSNSVAPETPSGTPASDTPVAPPVNPTPTPPAVPSS